MIKKLFMVGLISLLVMAVAACGAEGNKSGESEQAASGAADEGEEITVEHELGTTKVKKNPEEIVVFDFGALDTLDRLGVEVTGVAQSSIPPYLSKYEDDKYENVGSLIEPDFEKINEIQPDLIIISGRQADAYEELSKIAPTIYVGLDTENYMTSFTKNAQTLGKIFGREDQVDEKLGNIKDSIQDLNEKASASDKNSLIILSTGGKISAYGPNSRFGLIHDVFGVKAVDDTIEASTHGQKISFEYIAEKDPDYLFVIDRDQAIGGDTKASKVLDNELVKNTKAYKNDHIVYLDPGIWYLSGGGLASMEKMIQEVSEGFTS